MTRGNGGRRVSSNEKKPPPSNNGDFRTLVGLSVVAQAFNTSIAEVEAKAGGSL